MLLDTEMVPMQKKLSNYGNRNWEDFHPGCHRCIKLNCRWFSQWIVVILGNMIRHTSKYYSLCLSKDDRLLPQKWGNRSCFINYVCVLPSNCSYNQCSSWPQLSLSVNFHSCYLLNYEEKQRGWSGRDIFSNIPRLIRGIWDFHFYPFTFGIDKWNLQAFFYQQSRLNSYIVLQDVKAELESFTLCYIAFFPPPLFLMLMYGPMLKQMYTSSSESHGVSMILYEQYLCTCFCN